ncbi:MAG: hypothetical protein D6737_02130 [Chloroflexi bacterium]|nr:MAG: hypothetical protein CUN54_04795 [Phototrophicales bacterium]RMF82357.1 MAG: hypothetical protein D6737_02130 [Chloroflexota bacterium]
MRTPAGKECRHYYEDYYRGRNVQECRLMKQNPASLHWHPSDCAKCVVPEILNANASPDLELTVTAKNKFFGFGRTVEVTAACAGEPIPLEQAYTGCGDGRLNKGLDIFKQALEMDDDD